VQFGILHLSFFYLKKREEENICYATIILSVVLYGYETWSDSLRKKQIRDVDYEELKRRWSEESVTEG
jgi:hypothetical protein